MTQFSVEHHATLMFDLIKQRFNKNILSERNGCKVESQVEAHVPIKSQVVELSMIR